LPVKVLPAVVTGSGYRDPRVPVRRYWYTGYSILQLIAPPNSFLPMPESNSLLQNVQFWLREFSCFHLHFCTPSMLKYIQLVNLTWLNTIVVFIWLSPPLNLSISQSLKRSYHNHIHHHIKFSALTIWASQVSYIYHYSNKGWYLRTCIVENSTWQ
jgi:hypothetical protein